MHHGDETGASSGEAFPTDDSEALTDGGTDEIIAGRFRVLRQLGESSVGRLCVVEQVDTLAYRTLRVFPRDAAPTQATESVQVTSIENAELIRHRNIATVVEARETSDGTYVLSMEFVLGDLLANLLADGPLPTSAAIEIGRQVAIGLATAHEAQVVHGNLGPGSILITNPVTHALVRILDLGLPTLLRDRAFDQRVGSWVDVPYASPEVLSGARADERSDVFSLGATLYHLLTGAPPSAAAVVGGRIGNFVGPRPNQAGASVPPALDLIVATALAPRPADRFQGALEFAVALQRAAADRMPVAHATASWAAQAAAVDTAVDSPIDAERAVVATDAATHTPITRSSGRRRTNRQTTRLVAGSLALATFAAAVVLAVSRWGSATREASKPPLAAWTAPSADSAAGTTATPTDSVRRASRTTVGRASPKAPPASSGSLLAASKPRPAARKGVGSSAGPTLAAAPATNRPTRRTSATGAPQPTSEAPPAGLLPGQGNVATAPRADEVAPDSAAAPFVDDLFGEELGAAAEAPDAAGEELEPSAEPSAETAPAEESRSAADTTTPLTEVAAAGAAPESDATGGAAAPAADAPGAANATAEAEAIRAAASAAAASAVTAYVRAIQARDLDALAIAYPALTAKERSAWGRFFETARGLKARLTIGRVSVNGTTAEARITGTYEYENRSLNRTEREPVSFRATLTREPAGWRLSEVR